MRNLSIFFLCFLCNFGEAKEEAYFVYGSSTIIVVWSTVDKTHYLLVSPGGGVYEVQVISHERNILKVKIGKQIGLDVDWNNDGKKESKAQVVGKTVVIKQPNDREILSMNNSYNHKKLHNKTNHNKTEK